jgi:sulfate permease, SulP family
MAVINTSAMALVVNSALAGYFGEAQVQAMVVLALLVGLFQLGFGLLKLGYLTRFISNSVMTGFLTGVGLLIILSQLGDFTGYSGQGSNKVTQTLDLLRHLNQIDLAGHWPVDHRLSVELGAYPAQPGSDAGRPGGRVGPGEWPRLAISGTGRRHLRHPRLAASIGSACPAAGPATAPSGNGHWHHRPGTSQGFPNLDGRQADASGDFRWQGLANLIAGFFRGLPLGVPSPVGPWWLSPGRRAAGPTF